jgi:hypothetical protein
MCVRQPSRLACKLLRAFRRFPHTRLCPASLLTLLTPLTLSLLSTPLHSSQAGGLEFLVDLVAYAHTGGTALEGGAPPAITPPAVTPPAAGAAPPATALPSASALAAAHAALGAHHGPQAAGAGGGAVLLLTEQAHTEQPREWYLFPHPLPGGTAPAAAAPASADGGAAAQVSAAAGGDEGFGRLADAGGRAGPFSRAELRALWARGSLGWATGVWAEGLERPLPLAAVRELRWMLSSGAAGLGGQEGAWGERLRAGRWGVEAGRGMADREGCWVGCGEGGWPWRPCVRLTRCAAAAARAPRVACCVVRGSGAGRVSAYGGAELALALLRRLLELQPAVETLPGGWGGGVASSSAPAHGTTPLAARLRGWGCCPVHGLAGELARLRQAFLWRSSRRCRWSWAGRRRRRRWRGAAACGSAAATARLPRAGLAALPAAPGAGTAEGRLTQHPH